MGLGLNPDDKIAEVQDLLTDLDVLLIHDVIPGFGGQKMREGTFARVNDARSSIDREGIDIPIAVDGGVNLENGSKLIQAGADILILGICLFETSDMSSVVQTIRGLEQARDSPIN